MQLEAAHAAEITKLVEYVERKEDPQTQVVRTHRHNIDSAVLQTARRLNTEVQRETAEVKGGIAEKQERWQGNKLLKEEIESKCRLCKQHEETIDHLTSGCPILAKSEYLMRHDKFCAHLQHSIYKALGIEKQTNGTHTHTHTHMPKPVYEEGDVTVLWNQAVQRDREREREREREKLKQIGQI
jgi:hypothetical protein